MFEKKIIEPQSYLQQFKDFINSNDYTEIDIKDLLLKILDMLSEGDLKDLLNFVENKYPKLFGGLVEQLEIIAIDNIHYGKILGRDFKLFENIRKQIYQHENDHNLEMHLSLLVGMYVKYQNEKNQLLLVLIRTLLPDITALIKQTLAFVKSRIDSSQILSFETGLCFFFIYEKNIAFKKFKNLVTKNVENTRSQTYLMEYWQTINIFFNRLELKYIPMIIFDCNLLNISLTTENDSISKTSIKNYIDSDDYLKSSYPLAELDANQLINPLLDIKDYDYLEKIFEILFKEHYQKDLRKDYKSLNLNLGEIFLNNICNPIPQYQKNDLNRTKIIIQELFLFAPNFKHLFFVIIFVLKGKNEIFKWNTKFPTVLSNYLGKMKGLSEGSIKLYFRNDEENPVICQQDLAISFLKLIKKTT